MAKESVSMPAGLAQIGDAARRSATGALPPVHLWNPPFCGDIDIRIARDGTWFHEGSPIGRPALVRLFSTVLRRDPEGTMLVTPVEKLRIVVDDAPFVAVELAVASGPDGDVLRFRTNVDDWADADASHPLMFRPGAQDGVKPYLMVRHGLEAVVKRSVMLELVERGEVVDEDGASVFGVRSAGSFFPIAPASAIEGLA